MSRKPAAAPRNNARASMTIPTPVGMGMGQPPAAVTSRAEPTRSNTAAVLSSRTSEPNLSKLTIGGVRNLEPIGSRLPVHSEQTSIEQLQIKKNRYSELSSPQDVTWMTFVLKSPNSKQKRQNLYLYWKREKLLFTN